MSDDPARFTPVTHEWTLPNKPPHDTQNVYGRAITAPKLEPEPLTDEPSTTGGL